MDREKRKEYLAELASSNVGKALNEEFEVELTNLKEQLLEVESMDEVHGYRKAVEIIRNLQKKIGSANRSTAQEKQDEYV